MADNNENKVLNVPHLRFPEFSGEWEEHTLSEYLEFKNGLNPDAKRIGSGLPFISVMDILSEGVINYDNIRGKVNATEKEIECFGVKDGDLLFQRSSETLEDVGRANVYMDNRTAIYGGFVIRGRKIGNYDPLFFKYLLATPLARKRTCRMGAGAQHFNIGQEGLSKISLYFPSIEEQRKIAEFLSLIDERIATQNKIIEDLKKLKSAIVKILLCNRSGESFKLGDVGCFVRGLAYANEDVTEDKAATVVIRANNLNYGSYVDKGEVVYVNKTPTTSQTLRKGDIVICMANGSSTLVGKNSYYPFNDGQSTIGAFCGIYRTSHPLAKWLMQSQRYKRLVYQSLQGGNGAIANLNGDDILNMSFPLIEKEKSKSIIFTLEAIEKSLTVNKGLQRLYSMQKSYLLKQMFI